MVDTRQSADKIIRFEHVHFTAVLTSLNAPDKSLSRSTKLQLSFYGMIILVLQTETPYRVNAYQLVAYGSYLLY